MSLRRLLELIISALLLIVFAGTMLISVNNTRSYLQEQMESHAQDTATSLALSLRPAVEAGDWPTVNSMVDAIFDRGYYRELTILSIDGKVLVTRSLQVQIKSVPQWFVRLIPLETPEGEALLIAGWKQAGRLTIKSHPGYAYGELWRSAVGTFIWFAVSWAVAMAIVIAVIRYALAPLKEVEGLALAISAREFPVLEKLPWTKELRSVAETMNRMSTKLKDIIGGQVELIEKARREAYRDGVTGLENKRSFDARLGYLLENRDEFPRGALFLAGLAGFKDYNDRRGLLAGDELLRQAASLIQGAFSSPGAVLTARLGGADFAVLSPVSSVQEAEGYAAKMSAELARLHTLGLVDEPSAGHVGVAYYDSGRPKTPIELLSEADMALRSAQQKGANAWYIYEKGESERLEAHGATEWQGIIRDAIDNGGIKLFFQPVVAYPDRSAMHYEAFARLTGQDGAHLSAGLFMPMAERLGLAVEIDRVIVKMASECLLSMPANETVAINISPTSVHDPEFADWLCALLESSPASGRMVFESTEYGCSAAPGSLRRFVDMVRASGAALSLDHFGAGLDQFGYLRELKIDYIKIDGSLIRRIHEDKDNRFFVQALAQIAHGLDIKVIAESVETVEEWEALKGLGVDGAQGYFIGEPRAAG